MTMEKLNLDSFHHLQDLGLRLVTPGDPVERTKLPCNLTR